MSAFTENASGLCSESTIGNLSNILSMPANIIASEIRSHPEATKMFEGICTLGPLTAREFAGTLQVYIMNNGVFYFAFIIEK